MTLPTIAIGLLALVANAPSPATPSDGFPPGSLAPYRDAGATASAEGPVPRLDAAPSRPASDGVPGIAAIDHASAVVVWDSATVFVDPVGDQARYAAHGRPDVVVLTRPHPDAVSVDTMIGMLRRDTVVLAPQAVIDGLPPMISNNVLTPFAPGTSQRADGIAFTAVPAYATRPDAAGARPRERGDVGVVMEADGARVYVSGSTGATPEMRALTDIDVAIVSIDPRRATGAEEAAEAVAAFAPKVVIPYRYRGPDGFADLDAFEARLAELDPDVKVERLEWY